MRGQGGGYEYPVCLWCRQETFNKRRRFAKRAEGMRFLGTVVTVEAPTPETDSASPETVLPCGRLFLVGAGGSDLDGANDVRPTRDGGYIVAGYAKNCGAGRTDAFLLKFDSAGRLAELGQGGRRELRGQASLRQPDRR